ncbi:MAG: hypothetical protein ACFCU4_01465, partial [Puniceicoccaceae bacterium]
VLKAHRTKGRGFNPGTIRQKYPRPEGTPEGNVRSAGAGSGVPSGRNFRVDPAKHADDSRKEARREPHQLRESDDNAVHFFGLAGREKDRIIQKQSDLRN